MKLLEAVIDTNVVFAGLYSSEGASFKILSAIESGRLTPVLSVTLFFEYEHVIRRNMASLQLSDQDVDDFLDGICARAAPQKVHYLWRPQLPDPKDDHLVELSLAAGKATIITYNMRHFEKARTFGIRVAKPVDILGEIQ